MSRLDRFQFLEFRAQKKVRDQTMDNIHNSYNFIDEVSRNNLAKIAMYIELFS